MAARGKKPAITGIARPEGIVDDVIVPLGRKAVKKVLRTGTGKRPSRSTVKKNIRSEIRQKNHNTIMKAKPSERQYMTEAEVAKWMSQTKPRVTRRQVTQRRKSYRKGK